MLEVIWALIMFLVGTICAWRAPAAQDSEAAVGRLVFSVVAMILGLMFLSEYVRQAYLTICQWLPQTGEAINEFTAAVLMGILMVGWTYIPVIVVYRRKAFHLDELFDEERR